MLGIDALSEHFWAFRKEPILERFDQNTNSYCKTNIVPEISANSRFRSSIKTLPGDFSAVPTLSRSVNSMTTSYEINPYWSDHKHPEKPWNDEVHIGTISAL